MHVKGEIRGESPLMATFRGRLVQTASDARDR